MGEPPWREKPHQDKPAGPQDAADVVLTLRFIQRQDGAKPAEGRGVGWVQGTGRSFQTPQGALHSPKRDATARARCGPQGGSQDPAQGSHWGPVSRDPRLREESRCPCGPHVFPESVRAGSPLGPVPDTERPSHDTASGLQLELFPVRHRKDFGLGSVPRACWAVRREPWQPQEGRGPSEQTRTSGT